MLKILQARLQQYVNRELPDVQAGFRKGHLPSVPQKAGLASCHSQYIQLQAELPETSGESQS